MSAARNDGVGVVLTADEAGEGDVFVVGIGIRVVTDLCFGVFCNLVELPTCEVYGGVSLRCK